MSDSSKCSACIHHLPEACDVPIAKGETLLEASLAGGIPLAHVCGGKGRCSTCRVLVIDGLGHCEPRIKKEEKLAKHLGFDCSVRLACQTQVNGDVTVRRLILDEEDKDIARKAVRDVVGQPAGEEKHLAILFADLVGFTSFSENLPPYDVIHTLNRYYHRVGKVVSECSGSMNNYAGDGFMALFGVTNPGEAALDAVRAGFGVFDAVRCLGEYLKPLYGRDISVRVGIHYGSVVLGALGADGSRHITAIGDAVNFASRLEAENKKQGTQFLISRSVFDQVCESVECRALPQMKIRGKIGSYEIFEPLRLAV